MVLVCRERAKRQMISIAVCYYTILFSQTHRSLRLMNWKRNDPSLTVLGASEDSFHTSVVPFPIWDQKKRRPGKIATIGGSLKFFRSKKQEFTGHVMNSSMIPEREPLFRKAGVCSISGLWDNASANRSARSTCVSIYQMAQRLYICGVCSQQRFVSQTGAAQSQFSSNGVSNSRGKPALIVHFAVSTMRGKIRSHHQTLAP